MPLLETVSVVLRLLAGCWLLWRVPLVGPPPRPRGLAAVVVPARDEATALPALLGSLVPQLVPGDELVVVDDHSSDDTAGVAVSFGATVMRASALAPGWTGKAAACWVGVQATSAEVLVFVDADVTLAPDGLDRILAEAAGAGGLLSIQPHHVTQRPYERLSGVFNVVGLMGSDVCTPLGDRLAPSGAFGPVLVTGRDDYDAAGGHAHPDVRGAVLDDVALARRYRALGLPVRVRGGKGVATFRMYPDGLGSLAEGWSKNIAGGANATRPLTLMLVVAWLSLHIQATWWAVRFALTGDGPGDGPWLTAAAYGAVALQSAWMLRRVGRFGRGTAALFPLPLAFFLAVFARSLVLTFVRRKVRWKGREIAIDRAG